MQPGDMLAGRFELKLRASSGPEGDGFQAQDRASGETVAVTILREERPQELSRLSRDLPLYAELSHPAIARYINHGATPQGAPFLVTEWLSGERLSTRLGRGALSLSETAALGARVASALAAAHARGLLHRGLSPKSLFLTEGDPAKVKVLDLGLAGQLGKARDGDAAGLLGAPGYKAPEQVRSRQPVDARADVFALGCVLFEVLTGAAVFRGESRMAILAKVLLEEAPRLREIGFLVPESFDALITLMLAKDPSLRPRDGAVVVEELAPLSLGSMPPSDPAPAFPTGPLSAFTDTDRRTLSILMIGRGPTEDERPAAATSDAEPTSSRDVLRQAVESCGGYIATLIDGAAIVTIGGAAQTAPEQAKEAARCALTVRSIYPSRAISLSTGRTHKKGKFPIGDTIDRAARLLPVRPPSGEWPISTGRLSPIAIDDVTAGLLDARFDVVETPAGRWLRSEHEFTESARTLAGKETPCLGRERELAELSALLGECVRGPKAQALSLTAPPGFGKSRLVHELVRQIRRRDDGVRVWMGRGDSLRRGSPFALVRQVLRSVLRLKDGETLAARKERLSLRVGECVDPALRQPVADGLGELMGAPAVDEESAERRVRLPDPRVTGEQIRRAFLDFLDAETAAHPVLIVLDDLDQGDLPSVELIEAALSHLERRPLLVLALGRPELRDAFPALFARQGQRAMRLGPLTTDASAGFARQVLGAQATDAIVERVVTKADGHPFYLEELLRAVTEGRGTPLPDSLHGAVEARVATLPSEARRVVRAASVFGDVFWQSGIAALLGGGGAQMSRSHEWLSILVEREVLTRRVESRFQEEEEFVFRHPLLREVAYATLFNEDRVRGHRLIGRWLAKRCEGEPLIVAEHFERGEEPLLASPFYLRAAEQALRGNDPASARAFAARGLACAASDGLRTALAGLLKIAGEDARTAEGG